MGNKYSVLLIDQRLPFRKSYGKLLEIMFRCRKVDYSVQEADNQNMALGLIASSEYDLIVLGECPGIQPEEDLLKLINKVDYPKVFFISNDLDRLGYCRNKGIACILERSFSSQKSDRVIVFQSLKNKLGF